MQDKYTGSLSLKWYNKQKTIILQNEENKKSSDDIAPYINWINKDESLYYEINDDEGRGLKPFWVDANDIRVKEARPLVFKHSYKTNSKDKEGSLPGLATNLFVEESKKENIETDNILIRGDNLMALNSIHRMFENNPKKEKVKCIYIDPPYNTDQAFDNYDDSLAHSEWLTMMRDRLIILKKLLREDGVIFIQIDQKELAYLKIICDEIFGRDNFLIQINWQRTSQRTVLGQGATAVINIVEYILVYVNNLEFKNDAIWKIDKYFESDDKVFGQYGLLVESEGERKLFKELEYKGDIIRFYKHKNPIITNISKENKTFPYYIKNIELIARRDAQQKESSLEQMILSHIEKDGSLFSVERVLKQGKHKGTVKKTLYQNENVIYYLNTYSKVIDGKLHRKVDMNNMWLDSEISSAGIAEEGGVVFKRSKKPEALIERILNMCTVEGDLVLDSFAGSGTTLATAHKMKRNWIGIEVGKHCEDFIIERLKKVINGDDQSGISRNNEVNWKGGGAFNYYTLGNSIIKLNKDGSIDFNWKLGKQFIEESFLYSYDYEIIQDFDFSSDKLFSNKLEAPKVGIQKHGNKTRVAIITLCTPDDDDIMLKYEELHSMYKKVMDKYKPEFINVFTNKGVEIAFETKPEKLEVIKIPTAIYSAND